MGIGHNSLCRKTLPVQSYLYLCFAMFKPRIIIANHFFHNWTNLSWEIITYWSFIHICIYLIKNLTQDDIFAKRWFSHMQSALLICHVWIFFVKIGPCWNILCIQIMLHSENQKLVFQKKIYCMYHSRLRIVMYNGDLFCVCHKEKRRHRMIWC